jgi:hypothetical protein
MSTRLVDRANKPDPMNGGYFRARLDSVGLGLYNSGVDIRPIVRLNENGIAEKKGTP